SVGRGVHRPAIEPRKATQSGCRRRTKGGRQHAWARHRECPGGPAWSKNLAYADAPCLWEPGELAFDRSVNGRRSASGRRGAIADDARAREVRPRNRSWEADEQGGGDLCRRHCGAGGAKGGGQGERGRAKHAPDPGSGARVTGARARTESRKAEEGREVHCAPTPHLPRPASGSVLRAQTRSRPWGGWGDVADLRGRP